MKKYLLSIALIFFLDIEIKAHVDHYSNYNYLEYELFRNDKSIGFHKYEFSRDGDNLSIKSEVSFKITKLGVDLYKYFAKSEENYAKGVFKSYTSKTKQNKKSPPKTKWPPNHKTDHNSHNFQASNSRFCMVAHIDLL